jgi:hypothetical protein
VSSPFAYVCGEAAHAVHQNTEIGQLGTWTLTDQLQVNDRGTRLLGQNQPIISVAITVTGRRRQMLTIASQGVC